MTPAREMKGSRRGLLVEILQCEGGRRSATTEIATLFFHSACGSRLLSLAGLGHIRSSTIASAPFVADEIPRRVTLSLAASPPVIETSRTDPLSVSKSYRQFQTMRAGMSADVYFPHVPA